MTTAREHIIDNVVSALANTTGVGARIYRSRVTALSREESPALIVEAVSDTAQSAFAGQAIIWTLLLRISVIVRGDKPDEIADGTIESLHSKVMTDQTRGGYAITTRPTDVNFEMVDADQPAGVISCNFTVEYRTDLINLATSL